MNPRADIYISPLDDDMARSLAEFYSAFADPGRIKIMGLLRKYGEICVKDIATYLTSSESAISHQLKLLRLLRLIKPRQSGRQVFYSLDDTHIEEILLAGIDHLSEKAVS